MTEEDQCDQLEGNLKEEQDGAGNEQSNVQRPGTVEGESRADDTVQKETVVVPVTGRNDASHEHEDGRNDLTDEEKVHPTDTFFIVVENELRVNGDSHVETRMVVGK